jgi:hypothetical protein
LTIKDWSKQIVGGFRIRPFVCQNMRSFQLVKFDVKGSAAKSREFLSLFSFLTIHLSTCTLRHQHSNQISPAVQSIRVSGRLLSFLRDETPGANLAHPASYSLGFTRGVSSFSTSNAFEFGCDMCFRWEGVPGERGVSKILKVFSRQMHVMTTRKGTAICGVTSWSADYVKI